MFAAPDPSATLALRQRMVNEQLRLRGIRDERVLRAMQELPRERFIPAASPANAYHDGAVTIECGQTISQPYMVARMTELLELTAGSTVLEIGTGSGYQTAVLAKIAARVLTIEWYPQLMTLAAERLRALGLANVEYRCGDGSLGWAERAPFEAIIVTAGAPETPPPLTAQLAAGGRLVLPIGPEGDQTLLRIRRTETGVREEEILRCRFVKLQGEAGWKG